MRASSDPIDNIDCHDPIAVVCAIQELHGRLKALENKTEPAAPEADKSATDSPFGTHIAEGFKIIKDWIKPEKQPKHSPLPWRISAKSQTAVNSANGKLVCSTCSSMLPEEMLSNARLIVEAVNSHAALVRLRDAVENLDISYLNWRNAEPANIRAWFDCLDRTMDDVRANLRVCQSVPESYAERADDRDFNAESPIERISNNFDTAVDQKYWSRAEQCFEELQEHAVECERKITKQGQKVAIAEKALVEIDCATYDLARALGIARKALDEMSKV